jgi:hypothetical protein
MIIVLGYHVIAWPLGATVKFVGLLISSFIVSVAAYEFLIRRWRWVRPCFGLKTRRIQPAKPPQVAFSPMPQLGQTTGE